ncbi:dihydrolipoamide acetyltransferase component of pyruvate dehydrogenase complex [Longimycelium tulufanense]|uniref:Dihydrolipoamide acetyltransferase component of pyruvate dehydrogenase complex n=1 Tax=Longimycelium tulufanense TaxID=907463 RepID=A0A8J3CDZ4_9PSEU|nr:dihydrolipoamide acetyltransferase family protein [Longimycelium tulufanense]GGM52888.1 dihydrolipoamide acetyltransferase component of pyruvate dehydrogenase complex [Longimycelium tulufanense]
MPSVREFLLPDLGEGLTEAEVVRWLVRVGDVVAVDQPVVEVETAKATVEVPCPYAGVVSARHASERETLDVGRPLISVTVEEPGESATTSGTESGQVLVGYGTSNASRSRARRRVVTDSAVTRGTADDPVAVVSPVVRQLARRHGVDLARLTGSGPQGLITRSDVERTIALREKETSAAETARPVPGRPGGAERIPLRGTQRIAAEKFSRSRREIPDATCWVDADATALMEVREHLATGGQRVGLLALLARICLAGLTRYPELNATVDTERAEIVRPSAVHLGFAAQSDRGLVVPVVRDANRMTTVQVAAELERLTESARSGRLDPSELTGGTFTLNNYGVFGVDGSTPILNHPEAAMLGVGRIIDRPWAHQGQLALRQVVQLSLTFDHRVCDGAVAGGFLRFVADRVERPALLLRDF